MKLKTILSKLHNHEIDEESADMLILQQADREASISFSRYVSVAIRDEDTNIRFSLPMGIIKGAVYAAVGILSLMPGKKGVLARDLRSSVSELLDYIDFNAPLYLIDVQDEDSIVKIAVI
ncbi:MAG: hypothetical protein SVK54_01185 [candidate division WOR-3 bacterium]|nr:hypothetical protein [candidate division WOR-3 bacterium]